MSLFQFIIKSIRHYRRQHLALLAGTLISTAVLTGALITGDSVKHSLREMVDLRLGDTRFALETGDRFVRSEIATQISEELSLKTAGVLMNKGIVSNPANGMRVAKTQVLGIDANFWTLPASETSMPALKPDEAIISENLAEILQIKIDDPLILRMETSSVIPANAPFAPENNGPETIRLRVKAIAGKDDLGRFNLRNNQVAPYNIFISRDFLAQSQKLEGLSNLILCGKKEGLNEDLLDEKFSKIWTLEDAGLQIRTLKEDQLLELTSNRIFIDPPVSQNIQKLNLKSQPVLTYLVNNIRFNGNNTPYSFVTSADTIATHFLLKDNEIVINNWLADDLGVKKGDTLALDYFVIGPLRKLTEESKSFVVKEIIPLHDTPANRALMPDFPGLANAGSCSDWNTGVPINLEKIRDKDEKYWDDYRGTPKAFISEAAGKQIWANPFGDYTAFRFSANDITQDELSRQIMRGLSPKDFGFRFSPVYKEGLGAVTNAVDFGELFLSLSFFVIAAGVLLTALLYSLHTAARSREAGILSALGFPVKTIIRFRILEATMVAVVGSIAGAFSGILYNMAIMSGLNTVWKDVVRTNMLQIYVNPTTIFIGIFSGIIIAVTIIFVVNRRNLRQPANILIRKTILQNNSQKRSGWSSNILFIIIGFGASLALVIFSLMGSVDENSGLFLPAGGLFLIGAIALIYRLLKTPEKPNHHHPLNIFRLSLKNAGRNKTGSIATIALLALGTFTIIITGANQKTFYGASSDRSSGTGGFLFWAENSVPIIYNLNTQLGKVKTGLEDEPVLDNVEFIQFHSLSGDDASCLNLNQVSQPQILGVNPNLFDSKGSFSFATIYGNTDVKHPWLTLKKPIQDGIIPAFSDQTVITWGLMKKVGDTLNYQNEQGKIIKLVLMGGLKNSIFQGNILIADSIFLANFPSAGGSSLMLIDGPAAKEKEISKLLQNRLTDFGIEITPTTTRLATFNSVTNTYLSVFMILGGLGVLIGTIGLGIVLMRNILERKSELALLAAIGFQKSDILKLIFIENFLLLSAGVITGIFAALIGILPSLLSASFEMNTQFVILLIAAVFASGLLWIYFPARLSLKGQTVRDLQTE